MAMMVKCPLCGTILEGADEDALVAAADQHGDEKHGGMHAPRQMVLAAARTTE